MVKRRRTTTKSTRRVKRRSQRGKGIKDTIMTGLRFIKDNKLLSKGLGMSSDPRFKAAGQLASLIGLGKRRRTTRRKTALPKGMHGKGIFSDLGGGLGSVFRGIGGGLFGNGAKGTTGKRRTRAIRSVMNY